MKKAVYLLTAVFVLSATQAMAHCGMCALDKKGSTTVEDKVAKKLEKLTNKLSLTDEQAADAKVLLTEKYTKKKAIKEAKRAELDAVGEEYSGKLEALLTEDQKPAYAEMKAEWKKSKKSGCPHCDKGSKGSGHDHKGSDHEHKGSAE